MSVSYTSKITKWDHQKGFGYLRHQKSQLFLHRKDFAEHHKRPAKGDKICYQVGIDSKGRRCAVEAVHVNDGGKLTIWTWFVLALLLFMPVLAWSHFILIKNPHLNFLVLAFLIINLITYVTYKRDKALARAKSWRTPEALLHFLELIGGWPAALLAQRQFRHKCSKGSFQIIFWLIVILHISLAVDYLFDGSIYSNLLIKITE